MHDHQGDPDRVGLTRGQLQSILEMNNVDDDAVIDLEVWAQTDSSAINNLEERGGRIRVELDQVSVEKVTDRPDTTGVTVVRLIGHAIR